MYHKALSKHDYLITIQNFALLSTNRSNTILKWLYVFFAHTVHLPFEHFSVLHITASRIPHKQNESQHQFYLICLDSVPYLNLPDTGTFSTMNGT